GGGGWARRNGGSRGPVRRRERPGGRGTAYRARLPRARGVMRIALVPAGPDPDLRGSQLLPPPPAGGVPGRGPTGHLGTHGDAGPVRRGPWTGRILRDVALVVRLWATVRREAIDLIHAHNYEAAVAGLVIGRLTGRPVVYHGHTALADELPLYFGSALARRAAARVGRLLDASVPRRAGRSPSGPRTRPGTPPPPRVPARPRARLPPRA